MANAEFYKQLAGFSAKLEKAQTVRRKERIDRTHAQEKLSRDQVLQGLQFSPDITGLLTSLRQHVAAQKNRYVLPVVETPIALNPEAPVAAVASPPIVAPVTPTPFVQEIQLEVSKLLHPHSHPDVPAELDPRVQYYAVLMLEEIGTLTNETALLGSAGAAIIPRLKQAQQALFVGRMQDALTILRTVYKGNSHSHLLLYLLSQFLYLLHAMGQQGTLPEARELAQKSLIATDKVGPERLLRYRFHAIVTELGHDPERALGWLRDCSLLTPAHLQDAHGLTAHHCLYLLAWVVLAEIPVTLWSDAEYDQLLELVRNVPGGGLLYLFYFRAPLTTAASTRKEPVPQIIQLEQHIWSSWLLYGEIATPLAQLMQLPGGIPWTVRTRFARTLATFQVPGFDHVLLHIALDGQGTAPGFPDHHLRHALEDPNISYWSLWAGCLSPERETRQPHLLPIGETVEDHDMLTNLAALLGALHALEQKLVRPGWADLQSWMPRWQLDHLLALGTGSNRPRSRFAPALPPYSTYYRRWSDPAPTAVLPSEMITENAKRGGFASLFEAQAALEGGARLIVDPVHGLLGAQKRALAAARKAHPSKFAHLGHDIGHSPVFKMVLLLGLLGGGIAASISLTENAGQAIGLSLVIAGFVGILAVQFAKPVHT